MNNEEKEAFIARLCDDVVWSPYKPSHPLNEARVEWARQLRHEINEVHLRSFLG